MKTILVSLIAAMAIIAGSVISSKNGEISQLNASLREANDGIRLINEQIASERLKKSQSEQNSRMIAQEFQKSMERNMLPTITQ